MNITETDVCRSNGKYTNYDSLFPITYWYGPPSEKTTNAVYRQIAEAGFTVASPMCASPGTVEQNI